ncbi:hypothetical protein ACFQFC_06025 [Amorphoplanes digitatis]|uniref:Uncharacterized protein n=1 Tax=Actinoplanes digitatis TaxID=1868 RepID=A0A7W7HZP4_9ACTN|nr:hypothetical protein [Actinoplanes digitatis]MBB4763752.1 hypothetical protein [Actinoplanes digitatis]GID92990.1 hypothetical protein Adi01nite_24020 [Actinoplanes digitatis]
MDFALDAAYAVVSELFGPGATVPWWAWAVTLLMIFGKLLAPVFQGDPAPSHAAVPAAAPASLPAISPPPARPPVMEFRAGYFPASHFQSDQGR